MTSAELRKRLREQSVFQIDGVQIELVNDLFRVSCNGRELYTDDFERAFDRFSKEIKNMQKIK